MGGDSLLSLGFVPGFGSVTVVTVIDHFVLILGREEPVESGR